MFHNKLFQDADEYCVDFECPASFSYWALVQAVSIANKKRSFIRMGNTDVQLNLYTILCGAPNIKGYQAINLTRQLLDCLEYEGFLPDNLGLRKTSGLLVAMLRKNNADSVDEDCASSFTPTADVVTSRSKKSIAVDAFFGEPTASTPSCSFNASSLQDGVQCKAYVSTDFVSFCANAQTDFYGLLSSLWHGNKYSLSSPKGLLKIDNPYMNIFTSMTQIGIMDTFPDTYIGLNTMSSFIVAFEDKPRKRCPYPARNNMQLFMQIQDRLELVSGRDTELSLNAEAKLAGAKYYDQSALEDDSRLLAYAEARHVHMHRVAGCLALYEGRNTITANDIEDANALLASAESRLTEALGEFGNSKISAGRQKCLDLLRREDFMRKAVYRARCASFLFSKDFELFLTDMLVQGKIFAEYSEKLQDDILTYNPNFRKKGKVVPRDIDEDGSTDETQTNEEAD